MHFRLATAAVLSLGFATAALAATPAEVVARHVESMKVGNLQPIMDDYAADTVVVTPEGLVAGQMPAKGPGIYSGRAQAQRVFATLTDKDHHPGIKAMETRIEPDGEEVIYILSGHGRVLVNGEVAEVQTGSAVLFPQGEIHMLQNLSDVEMKVACFFAPPASLKNYAFFEDVDFPGAG